jgi:hypothetical protein
MGKSVMLLRTYLELQEQIENIINNHWTLGENRRNHLVNIWDHQIPKENPIPLSSRTHPFIHPPIHPPTKRKKIGLLGACCLTTLVGKDFYSQLCRSTCVA